MPAIDSCSAAAIRFLLRSASKPARGTALAGWQLNTILNFSSGTPFTVYDSANVALREFAGDHGVLFEPARSDRESEYRAAYRRPVGEPLGVPAAGSDDAGGTVRQRGPQRDPRAGHGNLDLSLLKISR